MTEITERDALTDAARAARVAAEALPLDALAISVQSVGAAQESLTIAAGRDESPHLTEVGRVLEAASRHGGEALRQMQHVHASLGVYLASLGIEATTSGQQIDRLRSIGDQYRSEEKEAARRQLPGIYMPQSGGGVEPALYDSRTVPKIGRMVVPDGRVRDALETVRPERETIQDPGQFIDDIFSKDGIIIGFSGYGTGGGRDYDTEYQGMQHLFDSFENAGIRVSGVVDGGTGYGVPGLSGMVAREKGHYTVGYAPMRGLRSAAPRNDMVVVGKEFGDEADALGSTADVQIVIGGGPIAKKEAEAARRAGSKIIFVNMKDYPGSSAAYLPDNDPNFKPGDDIIVCESLQEVEEAVRKLDPEALKRTRAQRRQRLHDILKKS